MLSPELKNIGYFDGSVVLGAELTDILPNSIPFNEEGTTSELSTLVTYETAETSPGTTT